MLDDDNSTHGPILSNNESIHALRQGVSIEMRTVDHEVADHTESIHAVPLRLVEKGVGNVTVEVMRDVIDEVERRAVGPRRRAGTVKLGSLDSLVDYVTRFKGDNAVAFAPLNPPGVTVIFDYHPAGADAAAWSGDRATYECPLSRQWQLWLANEGPKVFTQVQFGDLIEQNGDDLRGDDEAGLAGAAKMLEVARNLVVHQASKYERKVNPTTGEGTLVSSDEHGATSTKIPKGFGLAIPVFEGSTDLYPVECRIRFAMVEGRPTFSYLLHNRHQVFEHALTQLRKAIADRCSIPVFVGNAPAAAK